MYIKFSDIFLSLQVSYNVLNFSLLFRRMGCTKQQFNLFVYTFLAHKLQQCTKQTCYNFQKGTYVFSTRSKIDKNDI